MAKKKILFIDDEQDFLNIIGQRLEFRGYEVEYVLNGKDAIAPCVKACRTLLF